MAIKDFSSPAPSSRQRVMISTVDTTNRTVQAILTDKTPISIVVWEVGEIFRWPREGELWTIYQEQGYWKLDRAVAGAIEDMQPGDTRIFAPGTLMADSARIARWADVVFDADGNDSQAFAHTLGTTARLVALHGHADPAGWKWSATGTSATVTWDTTTFAAPIEGTSITATFIY